jgi:predicted phosphohydrolase
MKLAWCTDIHLDQVDEEALMMFVERGTAMKADGILIGGNIGESEDLEGAISHLFSRLSVPIWFVLGNHDYYGASFNSVETRMLRFHGQSDKLSWLPKSGVVSLGKETVLFGHGGWGDAQFGLCDSSNVALRDFDDIGDLSDLSRGARNEYLRLRGRLAGEHIKACFGKLNNSVREVILLTHVPPFVDACWSGGTIVPDDWLPFYTCKAVGDAILDAVTNTYSGKVQVLCGHTHGAGVVNVHPRVQVITGGAEFGKPTWQRLITV